MFNVRWSEAGSQYEQALSLSPADVEVLASVSRYKLFLGEYAEATELARRALDLDPNSTFARVNLSVSLGLAGDGGAALELWREAISLQPTSALYHTNIGVTYASLGNEAEAFRELQLGERLRGRAPGGTLAARIAFTYSQIGRPDDAARLFSGFEERILNGGSAAVADWVIAYLAVGENDKALEQLTTMADNRVPFTSNGYWLVMTNSIGSPILDQPEFVEVRSRLGFRE